MQMIDFCGKLIQGVAVHGLLPVSVIATSFSPAMTDSKNGTPFGVPLHIKTPN